MNKESLPKELEDSYIKKALDVLTNTYLNEKEREVYEGRLSWFRLEASALEKAKLDGKAEGIAEGKAEKAREMAKKMHMKGFSLKDISECTGLPIEEIQKTTAPL